MIQFLERLTSKQVDHQWPTEKGPHNLFKTLILLIKNGDEGRICQLFHDFKKLLNYKRV